MDHTREPSPRRQAWTVPLLSAPNTESPSPSMPSAPLDGWVQRTDAFCVSTQPTAAWKARAQTLSPTRLTRPTRSEEHTSELQSQSNLVCRLLLEKKKKHTCDI